VVLCIIVPVSVSWVLRDIYLVVVAVCNVGIAVAISKGLGEGWENGFIVFPCFPQRVIPRPMVVRLKLAAQCFLLLSNVRRKRKDSVSGFDDVGSIRDPVQHRFTEPGIGKHGRPFREG